jgi:hypothetical protein
MPTLKTELPHAKPILRRGFKKFAEETAIEYRRLVGIKESAPLPALKLADHLNIQILTPSDIPGITPDILHCLQECKDNWSAAIFIKNKKKYIIHNPAHSLARQESNLMHELAHAICEHELSELETALNGQIIPLRHYNEVQEAEAECLGGVLQLPQRALFYYHHILKKKIEEIASIFNASVEMTRYRLNISGVLRIKYNK